jgi:hypothetical protein
MPKSIQTAAVARKKPGRKKGDGGRNHPERNPTPEQRDLQEKAFYHSIDGRSTRWIAAELKIGQRQAAEYVRIEERRRADELGERRETQTARSVQTYERIKQRALSKSDRYDDIVEQIRTGQSDAKVNDHTLDAAIKAQERIDKVLGIDAPSKVDIGLQSLLESLKDVDDPQRELTE